MSSAATHQLDATVTLGVLAPTDTVFFWLALAAWTATALARLGQWRRARSAASA
jgi:hypothetical protein